jgi:hypothetical protein
LPQKKENLHPFKENYHSVFIEIQLLRGMLVISEVIKNVQSLTAFDGG